MTDEQQSHFNDARTMLAAALTILVRHQTGDHRELPDMLATLLDKAAADLAQVAEAA
ncbi:hypothetical protein GVN24_02345 [Rhizobium sp. CRIBSB]|nr:hypothetical protein [Rhizobium sp. CRIBSB]